MKYRLSTAFFKFVLRNLYYFRIHSLLLLLWLFSFFLFYITKVSFERKQQIRPLGFTDYHLKQQKPKSDKEVRDSTFDGDTWRDLTGIPRNRRSTKKYTWFEIHRRPTYFDHKQLISEIQAILERFMTKSPHTAEHITSIN